ncbi:Myelin-associated oligodendrocyte basic protein [Fukomys damarensis]|uniref:Myelin-associated oligodendrocyte basic protein n=1 Tax=Fukomys damarensis TaxID=885580 RepID=A0A091DQG8_FUKDA|nr:Myelin-associated oligodendrocyte basic protein [Fukomys damarensis]
MSLYSEMSQKGAKEGPRLSKNQRLSEHFSIRCCPPFTFLNSKRELVDRSSLQMRGTRAALQPSLEEAGWRVSAAGSLQNTPAFLAAGANKSSQHHEIKKRRRILQDWQEHWGFFT